MTAFQNEDRTAEYRREFAARRAELAQLGITEVQFVAACSMRDRLQNGACMQASTQHVPEAIDQSEVFIGSGRSAADEAATNTDGVPDPLDGKWLCAALPNTPVKPAPANPLLV